MSEKRTAAEDAAIYVMGRILRDPQIAYLMGPGTEAYRLLTVATAEIRGETVDQYLALIQPHIRTEAVVSRSAYEALQAELEGRAA